MSVQKITRAPEWFIENVDALSRGTCQWSLVETYELITSTGGIEDILSLR